MVWITNATFSIATTYGYGEYSCISQDHRCTSGAITASGEIFDPNLPTAAIYLPVNMKLRPVWVWLKYKEKCARIRINDKKGKKGFDLSPMALKLLGVKPHKSWSGKIEVCNYS